MIMRRHSDAPIRTSGAISGLRPAATPCRLPREQSNVSLRPRSFDIAEIDRIASARIAQIAQAAEQAAYDDGPDPYENYSRRFTDDGGVEIRFLTYDGSFWGNVGLFILWLIGMYASLFPAVFIAEHVNANAATVLMVIFGLWLGYRLSRWNYVWREIIIMPDCMILDGTDVFWSRNMEFGMPHLYWEGEVGTFKGYYGTRQIEYFTVQRLDEIDMGPELAMTHMQQAINQLWQRGSGRY